MFSDLYMHYGKCQPDEMHPLGLADRASLLLKGPGENQTSDAGFQGSRYQGQPLTTTGMVAFSEEGGARVLITDLG